MSEHPYKRLPDKAFWRRAVAAPAPADVDPVGVFDLRIDRDTRVATGGSCFAQHIARYLRKSGYNYYIAEPGHSTLPDEIRDRNGYGLYSARYGNLYTARQLLQTFQRAFGQFEPAEPPWRRADGAVVDPFRPTVQPHGFISDQEMLDDRRQHLAAVRRMFETLDVFVFTLGLTESWRSRADGAVFPICPGVEGGEFDAGRYEFFPQGVGDVIGDMTAFVEGLAKVNPKARCVFTVSPVPLMATATPGAHVLSATVYSKSVLRVAAQEMAQKFENVDYFPSFEVVTGSFNRGAYFAPDLRDVLETGVAHVMRLFMKHAAPDAASAAPGPVASRPAAIDALAVSEALVAVECDETALDR